MHAYRPDIDGLRMVAVVPVVLYHAGVPWVSGGYVGVDVFFVISGYLITRILVDELKSKRFSLAGFYERRVRRILPAFFAVIAASFVAAWVLLLPAPFVSFAQSALAATAFLSNIWFWDAGVGYFATSAEFEPLLHTWSLAVEEQFYIVFPLLLWACTQRSLKTAVIVVAVITMASFLLAVISVLWRPHANFYLTPTRAWELGVGALLALGVAPRVRLRAAREAIAAAGLATILFSVVAYDAETPFPGLAAASPCLGAAAIIWAGAQGPTLVGRALSLKPAVFVGLISYSLYLWHWPILAFARVRLDTVELPPALAAGAVLAAFAAATASWAWVERPFRRRPPDGWSRATIVPLAAAAAAVTLALVAVASLVSGAPMRFPPDVVAAYAGEYDINPRRNECLYDANSSGACRFGAPSTDADAVDVWLWGDSHADALLPGLSRAARDAGRVGVAYIRIGCPPLLNVELLDPNGQSRNCAAFNRAVADALRERADGPLVVVAARWAVTLEPLLEANRQNGNPVITPVYPPDHAVSDASDNLPRFEQSLTDTIALVRSTGRSVVILGGVPEIGWHVPRRLGAHLRWGDPLAETPTISDVERRQARANSVLERLAELPGVRLIPIAPHLCAPRCRVEDGGHPLYVDDDHLSTFGAETVIAPLLFERLWPDTVRAPPPAPAETPAPPGLR